MAYELAQFCADARRALQSSPLAEALDVIARDLSKLLGNSDFVNATFSDADPPGKQPRAIRTPRLVPINQLEMLPTLQMIDPGEHGPDILGMEFAPQPVGQSLNMRAEMRLHPLG